jgi:hypothetical protein
MTSPPRWRAVPNHLLFGYNNGFNAATFFRREFRMLKRLTNGEFVLAMLVASLFWICVLAWASAPTDAKKDACYRSAEKTGRSTVECKSFLERTTSDPIAMFTFVLAVSTVGLWLATISLYRAGEKQFRLARAEFLATHRPKIRIKNVWLRNEFWYDQSINVRVVCVNHGTTDAQLIDYGVDFLPVIRGKPLPPDHQFAFRRLISTVLKPNISGPFPDIVQPIDQDIEIAVRNGTFDFYCIGYLHYMDGSKNVRTTAFCRQLFLSQPLRGGGHFVKVENPDYEYED